MDGFRCDTKSHTAKLTSDRHPLIVQPGWPTGLRSTGYGLLFLSLLLSKQCLQVRGKGDMLQMLFEILPRKFRWRWKLEIPIFNGKCIFKWWIFHCHVSFCGCKFKGIHICVLVCVHVWMKRCWFDLQKIQFARRSCCHEVYIFALRTFTWLRIEVFWYV